MLSSSIVSAQAKKGGVVVVVVAVATFNSNDPQKGCFKMEEAYSNA